MGANLPWCIYKDISRKKHGHPTGDCSHPDQKMKAKMYAFIESSFSMILIS